MHKLKRITKHAVPAALTRAERYRLLNEPSDAESICLDILEVDNTNRKATVVLLLARTDQFDENLSESYEAAREVLDLFHDSYSKDYYEGVICERRARAHYKRRFPGSSHVAYDWFCKAMECYKRAEKNRPADEDELGAICTLRRRKGGPDASTGSRWGYHVGLFLNMSRGNVVMVSGNKDDRVGGDTYSRRKWEVYAMRMPA